MKISFNNKYRICLWHNYLGQGIGITNYLKYLIFMFGISSANIKWTMIIGLIWGISCFFIGWAWYKYGWVAANHEVTNKYNLFVREMRRKLVKK